MDISCEEFRNACEEVHKELHRRYGTVIELQPLIPQGMLGGKFLEEMFIKDVKCLGMLTDSGMVFIRSRNSVNIFIEDFTVNLVNYNKVKELMASHPDSVWDFVSIVRSTNCDVPQPNPKGQHTPLFLAGLEVDSTELRLRV